MIAEELISQNIPVVKTSDTGNEALSMMDLFKVSHLPIVNNSELLGLISDTDIYDNECGDSPIGNHKLSLMRPYVFANQHIYEVIDILYNLKLSVIPVLDSSKNYLGAITASELIFAFAKINAIQRAGSIIELTMNYHDYTSSQICQIVESNNCKILSFYVSTNEDTTSVKVTLKLDTTDATSVLQTFNRFGYEVTASFLYHDLASSFYQNRFESFMNYLNI
ncbi:MAG TPA: CBS domain-containing protein [Bacteroidales bacterium]|jgi:CBS domain-containing protein|nr:CBS domain-containing protein [Bacteroidales bacterium]MDD4235562.1 CBS domain-containing protein [Bacteroidales bacterium]MDY0159855.1 CBS domain-containing protein [Bacteroidales bacterium]HRW21063.1 CBS domain-containing protein [Bacteroidales bacterium]HXK81524.1 CBS domain-containing protein [Bacteroidales bacterium]